MDPSREYRFDGWMLSARSGDLVRAGRRTRLQSQPLHILEALLERPGELVTREELIARLWPSGVVDFDTALNSAVRRLRRALGDSAEMPRYIETIPRRGYRFVGTLDPSPGTRLDAVAPAPGPAPSPPEAGQPFKDMAGKAAGRGRRGRWPVVAAALLLISTAAAIPLARMESKKLQREEPEAAVQTQADERFLRAQHFHRSRTAEHLALARKYYTEAVTLAPGNGAAWAGLASVYWIEIKEGRMPPAEGLPLVRDAAERALAVDPGLAEAHLRLANYYADTGDPGRRDRHMARALELDPDDPLVLSFSAGFAAGDGRLEEAIALQRRSVGADPLYVTSRVNLVVWLMMAGRFEEARAEASRVQELSPAREDFAPLLAQLAVLEGRYEEALTLAAEMPEGAERYFFQAVAWHGLGRELESDAALTALASAAGSHQPILVAAVHAYRGEIEQAFEWLQASRGSEFDELYTVHSPFLRPLQQDPRWSRWVESLGHSRS